MVSAIYPNRLDRRATLGTGSEVFPQSESLPRRPKITKRTREVVENTA